MRKNCRRCRLLLRPERGRTQPYKHFYVFTLILLTPRIESLYNRSLSVAHNSGHGYAGTVSSTVESSQHIELILIMAHLARSARRLAVLQLLLLAVTSAVFFVYVGGFQAVSVWGGGVIAISNTLLLEWRRGGADNGRALSGSESLRLLYRTALERFLLVVLLFALMLGMLQLDPPALITGFIVGQLALVTGFKLTD